MTTNIGYLTINNTSENEVVCRITRGYEFADFVVTKEQLITIVKLIKMHVVIEKLLKYIDRTFTPIIMMECV